MRAAALVPDLADDVDGLANLGERFTFTSPEPVWAPLTGERSRAAGRLLAFVAVAGLGSGIAVWILGSLVVGAIPGLR
jgi:hypothetical protein